MASPGAMLPAELDFKTVKQPPVTRRRPSYARRADNQQGLAQERTIP